MKTLKKDKKGPFLQEKQRKEDVDNFYLLLQLEWIPSKSLVGMCCKDNMLQGLCWLVREGGGISCLDADLDQKGHLGLSQEDQGRFPEEGI